MGDCSVNIETLLSKHEGAAESYNELRGHFSDKEALRIISKEIIDLKKFINKPANNYVSKNAVNVVDPITGITKSVYYTRRTPNGWFDKATHTVTIANQTARVNSDKVKSKTQYTTTRYDSNEGLHNYVVGLDSMEVLMHALVHDANSTFEAMTPIQDEIREDGSVDYLIEGSEQKFVSKETDRQRAIYANIAELKDTRKTLTNPTELKTLDASISKLYSELERVAERVEKLKTIQVGDIAAEVEQAYIIVEDLLSQDTMSDPEYILVRNITNFWSSAGDFSRVDAMFLTEDELKSNPDLIKTLSEYKLKFDLLNSKINKIGLENIERFAKQGLDKNYKGKIFDVDKDISWMEKQLLSAGRMKSVFVQAINNILDKMHTEAHIEKTKIWKDIDSVFKSVSSSNLPLFFQQFSDGKKTGGLVNRFSADYFKALADIRGSVFKDNYTKSKFLQYRKWLKNNTLQFDTRLISPDNVGDIVPAKYQHSGFNHSDAERDAHIKELKDTLGEAGYAEMLTKMNYRLDKFNLAREQEYLRLVETDGTMTDTSEIEFDIWLKSNSPYVTLDVNDGNIDAITYTVKDEQGKTTSKHRATSSKYIVSVPKSDKGWYDDNFKQIEADPALKEAWTLANDVVKDSKNNVGFKGNKLDGNFLPSIKASVIDNLVKSGGGGKFGDAVTDEMKSWYSESSQPTVDSRERDPITGKPKKTIQLVYMKSNNSRINKQVEERVLIMQADGIKVTKAMRAELKREVQSKIANESSEDLPKLLKAMSMESVSYKHKSRIEDSIGIVRQQILIAKGNSTNNSGETLKYTNDADIQEDDMNHLKEYFDHMLDNKFYGYSTRKVVHAIGGKIYNAEELSRKNKLETSLSKLKERLDSGDIMMEEHERLTSEIQTILDGLGSQKSVDKMVESALQYTQLRGMGWNVLAGFANVAFGWISNMNAAADGRIIKPKYLLKAQLMVFESVLKNATGNKIQTDNAKKLRALMDKLDILNNSAEELFTKGQGSTHTKFLKRFSPYSIQERTEYIVQAPIMAATMMNEKALDPEGNEVSVWDAYDTDGDIKDGYTGIDEGRIAGSISATIAELHGDYKNKVMAKNTYAGKAGLQFRTWMINGFHSRFASEFKDQARGIDVKGRYNSLWPFAKALMTADLKNMSEVDKANTRSNMVDVAMIILLWAFANMMMGDDDDDNSWVSNLSLNMALRISTDLTFYGDPSQFETLIKSPAPVIGLVSDAGKVMNAMYRQFGDNPTIQNGTFKGMNSLVRETLKVTPGPSNALRTYARSQSTLK